jgi:aspartate kinase
MAGRDGCCSSVVVVKLGGSVLSGESDYGRAADFLCRRLATTPDERFVAVVSAQEGSTDALERTALGIAQSPSARALHLLWSTGEIRSVALLTLQLEALGVAATPLNVHQTGLRVGGAAGSVRLDPARLHGALAASRVVVVPGFLGTTLDGGIATLGRGGSDLTAVLLAAGLGAVRCELVKDVAGYFSADPHRDSSACHLPELTFADALALADSGCDLVQRQAIEAAARAHLPIVVRSLNESAPVTLVHGVSQVPVSAKPTNDNYHPVCPERTRREPAFAGEESAFRNQ